MNFWKILYPNNTPSYTFACFPKSDIRLLMIAHLVIEEPIMLSQQHKQPIGQEITVELRESFRKPAINNVVSFTKSGFSKRSTANNIAAMLNQADQVFVIEEQ